MTNIANTDKWGCRQVIAGLKAFGVRTIITSPGSRNAPLLMAANRQGGFELHSIVDERSAAFIALGNAVAGNSAVALICTSGTAMLNYAPALAEAYYRHIPLIAITADRPKEWIGQDDSQTIRQNGALDNIVKYSCSIKGEAVSETERWFINRTVNDAILAATTGRQGPVHINVELAMPLSAETDCDPDEPFRKIELLATPDCLSVEMAHNIATEIQDKSVLIVAGFSSPSERLDTALQSIAAMPNVAILAEALANLHCDNLIPACEPFIGYLIRHRWHDNNATMRPDILITFGGALVSASLKQMLREMHPSQHWHIGRNDSTIDCFLSLTRRVEISAAGFFPEMAEALANKVCNTGNRYSQQWHKVFDAHFAKSFFNVTSPWSAPLAVNEILRKLPPSYNVQLSNGMSVRYALASPDIARVHRVDCNRGVSGIDGCVSTAVGASMAYLGPTMIITGDMSMQYDIAALAVPDIPARMRLVVINNGGGGIFKFIGTTSGLPELPHLISGQMNLPLRQLAAAYGFEYLIATNRSELDAAIACMLTETEAPVLLEIVTDGDTDTEEMKRIYDC